MLIQPIYLDGTALTGYIAALENGVWTSATETSEDGSALRGRAGWGPVGGEGEKSRSSSASVEFADHDMARFNRLLEAGTENAGALNWHDITDADADMPQAIVGSMVQWECDIYVPDMIKMLQKKGGIGEALDMMEGLAPLAEVFGLDDMEMPSAKQTSAMRTFIDRAEIVTAIVGDNADSDDDWKVVGTLKSDFITDVEALDGPAICVGKVRKIVKKDRWHPLMTLPGMNLLGRDEKRRQERKGPERDDDKQNFVAGPALVLDMLAIYR